MLLKQILVALGASLVTARDIYNPYAAGVAPNFTYLFTALLTVSETRPPIRLYEGGIVVENIFSSGPVRGPAMNATVKGGLSPTYYDEGLLYGSPNIQLYGSTDDGEAFSVHVTGAGLRDDHWDRVEISVSGSYEYLQNEFIIGHHITINKTAVTVPIYCVGCNDTIVEIINGGGNGNASHY